MINSKVLPQAINSDDAAPFLPSHEVLNIDNLRVSVSADGKNYALKNLPSTQSLYTDSAWTTPRMVGRVLDGSRNRLIWLHQDGNPDNDAIYSYDLATATTYTVLKSSQTAEGLHFSTAYRADRNIKVAGDLLVWTNDQHEPYCINMEAGIKLNHPGYVTDTEAYAPGIPYTTLTLIKRPPARCLQVTKVTDLTFAGNDTELQAFQFLYRYQYKNYHYSALSPYAPLIPANGKADTFNAIDVKLPFGEPIDDYIQGIDICVRYGNTGKTYIIKTYDKRYAEDAAAIAAHNGNTVQLGFRYYNNINGIALDDTTANTAFDGVALTAKTLEIAKNRLFLGNVKKGYTTPAATSLACTAGAYNTGGGGSYVADWKYIRLNYQNNSDGSTSYTQYYYAYNATIGAYFYDSYKFTAGAPISLDSADATTTWPTETELAAWLQRNTPPPAGTHWLFGAYVFTATGGNTTLLFEPDLQGLQFFKSSSAYKVALAFYDRYRRKSGVTRPVALTIADRTYNQTTFAANITWALSNTNAFNEIPDTAYYYQIHITKSEAYSAFLQIYAGGSDYVLKNQDGTYSYSHSAFAANSTYAVALDITSLNNKGLGYVFDAANGDLCRLYRTDGTNKVLRVIGQDGNFVLLSPENLGTLSSTVGYLIELFTPNKTALSEVFFETGDLLEVTAPATSGRTYSQLSGAINGDCYAIQRDKGTSGTELYVCEAMNPNDKVWFNWDTDRGWTNIVDTIGQQQKTTSIDWSDTFINGTKVNNFNKFGALNTKDIGNTCGSIQKLQLANKQEEDGTVLLILSEGAALSAYLSERQLTNAASNGALVTTDEVIGSINELKNSFGTVNPESVTLFNGTIWWWSARDGRVCQYGDNGVFPVSDFKMSSFFDRYSKKYLANGYTTYTHPVHCVYDASVDELLIALPQVEAPGFTALLPSYGGTAPDYAAGINNPFSFYDGGGKTLIYKPLKNQWTGSYPMLPDGLEAAGNRLFSWKDATLHVHNEDFSSFGSIYGQQYPQRIALPVNIGDPSAMKQVMDIALEGVGGVKPTYTVLYSKYPIEQLSDLTAADWINEEGILRASFLRDRLTFGDAMASLYEGELITSQRPVILIEFQCFNQQLIITFINIFVSLSRGQNSLLAKQ